MTSRPLPDPGFAGDPGDADPALAAAVATGDRAVIGRALLDARLLVPVVAVLTDADTGPGGRRREKSSDMAAVTVVGRDGRRALLAFTAVATLHAWRPDARPVPVAARHAALAAYDEGADALLLDLAGPQRHAVEGPALRALAEGREPIPPYDDPDVLAAVRAAGEGLPGVIDVEISRGDDSDLRVVLSLSPGADPHCAAASLAATLRDEPLLRARLERGIDLAVKAEGDDGAEG